MLAAVALAVLINVDPPVVQDSQDETTPRVIRERQFQLKDLAKAELVLGEETKMTAWVMDEEAKRQEGMMFVRDSDFTEKQGMIFVFKEEDQLRFWMKNTYVPLDIAYLTKDGKANRIYTMKAFDTYTDYSSNGGSMYALEVKAGYFKKIGFKVGSTVKIPSSVKAKD